MNAIPDKIGRYKVERLLGQGAMGSVYLGRDPDLDRAVAIKTVRDLGLEEERLAVFLERFKNEAKAAARLAHPAIVAVYDVGEDPEHGPYLVFEYVAGSTLKQIVRGRGALSAEAAVRLGRQIASALDLAHAAGVIHRDIKPDNILVSASGDAKLADFGIARLPDAALTKEGQFLGTPCYAAPETLERASYGPHSDIFSFAAVLYEAIAGVRAFPGDDAISVAHHVVHDEPVPLGRAAPGIEVPAAVERAVMRGLGKDPLARQASAMEVVDAVAAGYIEAGVLDRDPTGAQVLTIPAPAPPPARGGSTWAFAIAVGALAVIGVGFVAYTGVGDGPAPAPALDAGSAAPFEPEDASEPEPIAYLEDGGPPDAGAALAPDTGPLADPELPDASAMSAFDRDEAAKDEVDAARAALAAGELEAARLALRRARAFDPGNSDIEELEAHLAAAIPGRPATP